MRFKLTILLLALNAALAGIIFYVEKVESTRDHLDASSRLILNPAFIEGLQRIHIETREPGQDWIIEKQEDRWLVSSPFQWKANPYAIEQLLFQLRRLSWESRFPVSDLALSDQNLASYNLESPPINIRLRSNSTRLNLALGAPTEIGNRLYVMLPDGEFVYVVPRTLLDFLNRDLEAFLDRQLFNLPVEETRALQVQDRTVGNVRVRLERRGQQWQFVSPMEALADPERVNLLLREWGTLEIEGFMPGMGALLTLEGSALRLSIEGMSRRETLILRPPENADAEGMYYLGRREAYPAVFRIDARLVEELRAVQEDLRERRVLARFTEDWSSLEIQFDNLGLTLQELENGSWQVLYTDEKGQLRSLPAEPEAVGQLTQLLQTMEAVRFVTDAPSEADMTRFGLAEPQRRLLIRKGNREPVEFTIGGVFPEAGDTLLYATTNQSDSVFLVRPHVLSLLSLDPFSYRDRTVRRLPEAATLGEIRLIHRPSGLPVPLEAGNGDPSTAELMTVLRDYFREIRFERFLNRPFTDPYERDATTVIDWPYLLEAEVRYPSMTGDESQAVRIFLSERLGGTTQYAGDPESGLVGVLPLELIEALDSRLAEFPDSTPEAPEELDQVEDQPPPE